ncbi:hypothetical protein [Caldibacillus debilis]|uniref:Uncharacterized protein n=1 Tax=Caldibacillus debilis GB1 TaxID=1339248 RepID=A0A420VEH4_9BACI|nr:hypothetical protein [Caldibacillus debilis]RKO61763.1 hypothetical protein Cdeb_01234 [Caldibacillus debilis GB1]
MKKEVFVNLGAYVVVEIGGKTENEVKDEAENKVLDLLDAGNVPAEVFVSEIRDYEE